MASIRAAYTATGEILFSLIEQGSLDPPGDVSEAASQRMSLTASLLQSTIIVEQAITSGFYWAATGLLRQHMEALARIILIRSGKSATDGGSPNVGVLPFGLARNYGRLSQLAHVSKGEVLQEFSSSELSDLLASPMPRYIKDWANDLLAIHTGHMITLAFEISYLHSEVYPGRDLLDVNSQLYKVAKVLEELGHWKELGEEQNGEPRREDRRG